MVHTSWPGLAEGRHFGPGDLAVTMDYRDVLGEVVVRRVNDPALSEVFPGYPVSLLGLVTE